MVKIRHVRRKKKFSFKELFRDKPFLIGISIPILIIFTYVALPFSPFNTDDIYITGNDVIKNFSLDSFDGEPLDSSGAVQSNKLKFETGAFWKATEDSIDVINSYESEEKAYILYSITFTNKLNIFTNVRLDDAIGPTYSLDSEVEPFLAGSYEHLGLYGHYLHGFDAYLDWTHYDFGNIRTWNSANNHFQGGLVSSFDINPSPLPEFITDDDGNTISKDFDYITVNGLYVNSDTYGSLSSDVPYTVGLTPAIYDAETRNEQTGGEPGSDMEGKLSTWDPNPVLSAKYLANAFDPGVQSMSVGASLNPTTKGGETIWNPEDRDRSMSDCEFTYNVGSLSPIVKEYQSTLTYYEQSIQTQDVYGLWWDIKVEVNYDDDFIKQESRSVALHVENRYIQAEIGINFRVWTSYDISALIEDNPDLSVPAEYYDDIVWDASVDGFGGGQVFTSDTANVIAAWVLIIVIIAVIGIVAYVIIKFGGTYMIFRMGQKSGQGKRSKKR